MLEVQKDVYSAFRNSSRSRWWRHGMRGRRRIRRYARPSIYCDRGTGKWKRALRRRWCVTLVFQQLRKAVAERAAPGSGADLRIWDGSRGARKTAARAPAGMVSRLRRAADEMFRRCGGGRRENSGLEGFALGLRAVQRTENGASGWRAAAVDRKVFQHRSSTDERIVDHGQADHAATGTVDAHDCRPERSGPFAAEHHGRRIGTAVVVALQRSVERVLRSDQFSDAVRKVDAKSTLVVLPR